MTITTRLRLIILQPSQRGFTEARTFMAPPPYLIEKAKLEQRQKERTPAHCRGFPLCLT
jgi:hypothetical protein